MYENVRCCGIRGIIGGFYGKWDKCTGKSDDPFCIALVYDVSYKEVQKTFNNYIKKYGNMLSRREIYDLVYSYVNLHKEDMK